MTANNRSDPDCNPPSVKECITALVNHKDLFEMIADYPQAGINERFGKHWALNLAYIESNVHRYARAAEIFLLENAKPGGGSQDEGKLQTQLTQVMDPWVDSLFLHSRAVKNSREMALAPSPSKVFTRKYRLFNSIGGRSIRAANGEMSSIYGRDGDPIPSNLATADNEDLEPMAQFVNDWLMNPFIDYVGRPFQSLCFSLPMYEGNRPTTGDGMDVVNARTISAVAEAFVCVVAILVLIAPIATINTIQGQTLRIVVIPLFCFLFAASAQFMGPRSMPLYTLVTAYFQAMVVFVGTTSEQSIRQ
ncbi:hypothetical protein EJ02DRAFT_248175 [Clathrospora elynae]|uniref:DUF6594 domain-containing protein n=1 Tax=Clathrospora elynae TaxID=706981 RepID=A0A6A5T2J2_9PLEO|nr:hypothetical protein EJ02DRAFT_248175 [Clathrospora elynae]